MTVHRTRRSLLVGGLCLAGAGIGGGVAMNVLRRSPYPEDVRILTWMDLMPEAERAAQEQAQLQGLVTEFDLLAQEFDGGGSDAPWQPMPQSRPAAQPRADLDGQTVALLGYMTPLDFYARETKAFLLVPYVGACIHVPAPPPNQIVLVQSEDPVPVLDMWQPFTAVGTLHVQRLDTILAESAYVMTLDQMVALDASGGPEDDSNWEMQ